LTFFLFFLALVIVPKKSNAQNTPIFLPPNGLITYASFDPEEINTFTKVGQYPYRLKNSKNTKEELNLECQNSMFGNTDPNYQNSFDRFSNKRPSFINQLSIQGTKINYSKPITVGFWIGASSPTSKFDILDYAVNDKIELTIEKLDNFITVHIKQKLDNKFQEDYLDFSNINKPLYSVNAAAGNTYWNFFAIVFDGNSIGLSVNGSTLETKNLPFFTKSAFKKEKNQQNHQLKSFTNIYKSENTTKIGEERAYINIDDLFIYERLLTNDEILAIAYSEVSPYYFKEIRDSINAINTAYRRIINTNDLSSKLTFLNKDLHDFSNYSTKFNQPSNYVRAVNPRANATAKIKVDSLKLTHNILEKAISRHIGLVLDSLLLNPTKERILTTYAAYNSAQKLDIDPDYLDLYSRKFKQAVVEYSYNILFKTKPNSDAQKILFSDLKQNFSKIMGSEIDIDKMLTAYPPQSGTVKYYSTTNEFIKNPTYDYNDILNTDPNTYSSASTRTIQWDQKELTFSNYKLEGTQRFYNAGVVVYEYEFKNNKPLRENWYHYPPSPALFDIIVRHYDSEVYAEKGRVQFEAGDYSKALQEYKNASKLAPENSEYHKEIGLCTAFLEKYEEAVGDFTRAIELDPNVANYYFARGVTYFQLNNLDASYNDLSRAQTMGYIDDNNILERVNKKIKENQTANKTEEAEGGDYAPGGRFYEINEGFKKAMPDIIKSYKNALNFYKNSTEGTVNPKDCFNCNGTGVVKICKSCNKKGRVYCRECGGKGYAPRENGRRCLNCSGTGIQVCPACNGKIYNIKCRHSAYQF
jgi:tetratricopeptide (TPR) repeat protein